MMILSWRIVLLATIASAATLVSAQVPSPAPATDPAAPTSTTGSDLPDAPSLELETRPDGYTYSAQGRRDPFVNLLKSAVARQDTQRPTGIAGFIINEVHLRGIVKDAVQGYIALLLGPDGKTYFCKLGQRLYDGTITAIDAATVTFRQEVTDPLSREKTRDLKKTLYPSEEARQ
jgi:Tfp pilus assembly protein PilP